MLPPAPARFSITIGCLRISSIFLVRMRAITSLGPPGAKPIISVIGLLGQSAARASGEAATRAALARKPMAAFIVSSAATSSFRGNCNGPPVNCRREFGLFPPLRRILLPRRADRDRPHRRTGRALRPQRQDDGAG